MVAERSTHGYTGEVLRYRRARMGRVYICVCIVFVSLACLIRLGGNDLRFMILMRGVYITYITTRCEDVKRMGLFFFLDGYIPLRLSVEFDWFRWITSPWEYYIPILVGFPS